MVLMKMELMERIKEPMGLDSSTPLNSLVDESSEQETSPPYPYPLRGVEVRIRVYEPRSRQVRQVTVRHTFVPH